MENIPSAELFRLGQLAREREELDCIEKHDGHYSFDMKRGQTDFHLSAAVGKAVSDAIRSHWKEIHAGAKIHLEAAHKRAAK